MTETRKQQKVVFDGTRQHIAVGFLKSLDAIVFLGIFIAIISPQQPPLRGWKLWASALGLGTIAGVSGYWKDRLERERLENAANIGRSENL